MKKIVMLLLMAVSAVNVFAGVPFMEKNSTAFDSMNYFTENPAPGSVYGDGNPFAELHTTYADHNQYENGQKGMTIHTDLHIKHAAGRKCKVVVYFHYQNGDMLMDNNGKNRTPNGQCAINKIVVPNYDNTHFADLQIFMPYNELECDGQVNHLRYLVKVYDVETKKFIQRDVISRNFKYTR